MAPALKMHKHFLWCVDMWSFVVAVMFGNSRISFCADGLFGQCQAPHQEAVQYQVSVPVLHKLQEVLKDLMVQGESLNAAAHF